MNKFANKNIILESWFEATKSSKLKKNSKLKINISFVDLVLIRNKNGELSCFENTCPHMGADLSQGKLKNNCIECPFHNWTYNSEGKCVKAYKNEKLPNHKLKKLNVIERFGYIWVYLGNEINIDLPILKNKKNYFVFSLPNNIIYEHPHIVLGNGLDKLHLETVHGLKVLKKKLYKSHKFVYKLDLISKMKKGFIKNIIRKNITSSLYTIGGNMALLDVKKPFNTKILFTGKPDRKGNCITKTIVATSFNPFKIIYSFLLIILFVGQDFKILNSLNFKRNFVKSDESFINYIKMVEELEIYKQK